MGSSSTSNLASMAMTRARWSCATIPFDNSRILLARRDIGLRQKTFCLPAVESRMHPGHVVERLRNPHPARKHGDIGDGKQTSRMS